MKFLTLALLFCTTLAQAQQNVVSSERLFPKVDKIDAFEKALAAHAKKFHTGKWKWRVFEIQSGPDFGGYHITEGPLSWEEIEQRGELNAEHMADWSKNIAPLLTEKATSNYAVFQEDLSNVAIADYSDWINITRWVQAPGYSGELREVLTKMKKAWVEDKSAVAVYANSSSGAPGYAIVTRYKQGLKERNPNFRPPFRETFEKVNGAGTWMPEFQNVLKNALQESYAELLRFRADLSSR